MKGLVMKYKFLCCFILLVIGLSPMTLAYSTSYSWSVLDSSIETSAQSSADVQNDNFLNLDAESAILIEQNSGQILYSHNIHEKLHPASVTKIMSLLLIMEALDSGKITLETQIPCSENAANMGGSQIWLDPRENLSVNDMLKAIAVVSANDCVTAIAEYLGGSTENFVKMMNEKAKELGMNDTNFVNCHGLDEDDHLTSAYDIALMSRELLTKHPQITNYTTIWTDSLRDGKSALSNTNKLVRNYSGCTGLKTGSTSKALFNLSASATRNDLSLISVIMKAPTSALRFSNAIKLLDYGFTNYSYKSFANQGDFGFNTFSYKSFATKGEVFKSIPVTKGTADTINAIYESSPSFLIKKGEESSITYEINLPESIQAPITQGQQLGTISYYLNNDKIAEVSLIAENSINKISFINRMKSLFSNWFNLTRSS